MQSIFRMKKKSGQSNPCQWGRVEGFLVSLTLVIDDAEILPFKLSDRDIWLSQETNELKDKCYASLCVCMEIT